MNEKEQKGFQEKLYVYQMLKEQKKLFSEQLSLLKEAIEEDVRTERTIEKQEKKKGKKVMCPLGSECYYISEIKNAEKIIVNVGAGILIEKNLKEAKKFLSSRKTELQINKNNIEKKLEKIERELIKIEPEIQRILQKNED